MHIRTTIGNNIRAIRRDRQLSQVQVSRLLGAHSTYMSVVERGTGTQSIYRLVEISDILGVNVSRFFEGL